EALAYQGRFFHANICPFFDARRQMVYTGLYQWKNSQLSIVDKEQNILMEDWLRELAEKGREVLFLSPDLHLYKEMITDLLGELESFHVGPVHVASHSGLDLAGKYQPADHTHALTPNYLRLDDAEAN